MSPCGAVEMPLRYIVPTMGSAPRSSSKLTSSKFPVKTKRLIISLHAGLTLTVRCCRQLVTEGVQQDSVQTDGRHAASPYLQQQPAAAGSPCSSPSRPAGNPPRWLWRPAAAAEVVGWRHRRGREEGEERRVSLCLSSDDCFSCIKYKVQGESEYLTLTQVA